MKYLLDTHILLWALQNHPKLSQQAKDIISNPDNLLYFSSASVWEVAIKLGRGYVEDLIEPTLFYQTLIDNDYLELPVNSQHASEVLQLPNIHKDPFDRIIIAQSNIEQLTVMTVDSKVIDYMEHYNCDVISL